MSRYYKNSYFIVFYDKDDENLVYMFDNTREILNFIGKPVTRKNVLLLNTEIYRALKTDTHLTRFMNGEILRVYIIRN